jgi:hypothetical protein
MSNDTWDDKYGLVNEIIKRSHEPLRPRADNLGKTIIANMMSGYQRRGHPALLVEDGATFHGLIQPLPDNQFRASCRARLDHRSHIQREAPEYRLFDSKNEARAWVHGMAALRHFPRISWDDEYSARND